MKDSMFGRWLSQLGAEEFADLQKLASQHFIALEDEFFPEVRIARMMEGLRNEIKRRQTKPRGPCTF